MTIFLKEITKDNWEECALLKVAKEEERFVAPNVYSILQSKYEPDKVPLAVYNDETMVGFLMYGRDPEDGRYWILRLMIDKNYQSQGFGKSALLEVIKLVKSFPDCSEDLTISYKPDNEVADRLYTSIGFTKTGEILGDINKKYEVVARLILK